MPRHAIDLEGSLPFGDEFRPFEDQLFASASDGHVEQAASLYHQLAVQAVLLFFVLLRRGVLRREIDADVFQDLRQVAERPIGQFQIRQLRADSPVEAADRDHRPFQALGTVPCPKRDRILVDHSLGRLVVILFAARRQPR